MYLSKEKTLKSWQRLSFKAMKLKKDCKFSHKIKIFLLKKVPNSTNNQNSLENKLKTILPTCANMNLACYWMFHMN